MNRYHAPLLLWSGRLDHPICTEGWANLISNNVHQGYKGKLFSHSISKPQWEVNCILVVVFLNTSKHGVIYRKSRIFILSFSAEMCPFIGRYVSNRRALCIAQSINCAQPSSSPFCLSYRRLECFHCVIVLNKIVIMRRIAVFLFRSVSLVRYLCTGNGGEMGHFP